MTKELASKLPGLGAQENSPDPMVYAKFFYPMSSYTLYVTEYDPAQRIFFGYVTGLFEDEWGYTSLDELEGMSVHGVGIERDLYFSPTPISKLAPGAVRQASKKTPVNIEHLAEKLTEADIRMAQDDPDPRNDRNSFINRLSTILDDLQKLREDFDHPREIDGIIQQGIYTLTGAVRKTWDKSGAKKFAQLEDALETLADAWIAYRQQQGYDLSRIADQDHLVLNDFREFLKLFEDVRPSWLRAKLRALYG